MAGWHRRHGHLSQCGGRTWREGDAPVGFGWHARDVPVGPEELAESMSPWMTYCIEQFGPERSMFESNFPPDKVSYSYNVLYNAFKRLPKGYLDSERAEMFHGTAERVYRIKG
jgi:L-fuconolactonase